MWAEKTASCGSESIPDLRFGFAATQIDNVVIHDQTTPHPKHSRAG
jgi:hypothetical protein